MASLFKRGEERQKTTSGPSPAGEELMRLLMQTLAARYSQDQGKPQTFADYIKNGPRGMPAGLDMTSLLAASGQPGAFNKTTTTTGRPASASPFEQGVGVLSALASLGLGGAALYNQFQPKTGLDAISGDQMGKLFMLQLMGIDTKPLLQQALASGGGTTGANIPINTQMSDALGQGGFDQIAAAANAGRASLTIDPATGQLTVGGAGSTPTAAPSTSSWWSWLPWVS